MFVTIIRETDDPVCPRASIGGTPESEYYIVYRNEPATVLVMLQEVVEAFALYVEDYQRGQELGPNK